MMIAALSTAGGALNIAGSVGGATLQQIVQTCDNVKINKKKSKQLSNKCVQIINMLNEQESQMEGTEIQKIADQLLPYNTVTTLGDYVDAISSFSREMTSEMGSLNATLNSNSYEHLPYPHVITMQNSGQHVAEHIMEAGQTELRNLREANSTEQGSSRSRSTPTVRDSQRYLQYQRGLIKLHRETGIPPTIKVLNGEVTRSSDLAVDGGVYSDIWIGTWLGEEKVALKALRNIKASDSRAQKRFENEIKMWAELKHAHILPFYGIVTDLGQHIHMVSPWQDNGNVLKYVKIHIEADRMLLVCTRIPILYILQALIFNWTKIRGAAQGLEYLHSKNVIHGNIKCANILVSSEGESCICDFGMSKVIEEVTGGSASATLTAGGSARWLAPELIEGSSPTMGADTYSYAMAILELLTEKQPYAEIKRDAAVIHDIIFLKKTPSRPQARATHWLSDALWDLMQRCWHKDSLSRPSMAEVTTLLMEI
ncbi:TKL/TKL-ccin protein kinase [Pholiota molesta]|nr:TKL/TKL-ccin protein kinase [Pholiota molesta]